MLTESSCGVLDGSSLGRLLIGDSLDPVDGLVTEFKLLRCVRSDHAVFGIGCATGLLDGGSHLRAEGSPLCAINQSRAPGDNLAHHSSILITHLLQLTWITGRRFASRSASRSTSRVTGATSPEPKSGTQHVRTGLPSVHSK